MTDVMLLSTADWDHPLWTNKQHQALSLAELGYRVLYIDSLGVRSPRVDRSDSRRIWRRLRRGLRGPRQVRPNLWVISPLVLPGRSSGFWGVLNRWSLALSLIVADWLLDLRSPLLWTFNPQTLRYLSIRNFHATVYHCVDRIQAQPGMPAAVLEDAEMELCGAANAVFTTSPKLQAAMAPRNPGTHYFGNVADADHFGRALDSSLAQPSDWPACFSDGPVLMFVGAIDAYKLDLSLLEILASDNPQWTFVFIGPVGETDPNTDVRALRRLANVHLLGPRPYSALPSYLAQADVALLPLQLNTYTRHMYPMKFFEYLAAGCPVVATAIPSLLDQGDVAKLCPPEPTAFALAIADVLNGNGATKAYRLERAKQNTYIKRTRAMLAVLERHGLLWEQPVPPQAPPYHHLRLQWRWSWISAQCNLLAVNVLDWLGRRRWADACLSGLQKQSPRNTVLLAGRTKRCLRGGHYKKARHLLERIWQENGWVPYLHHLVFASGCWPATPGDQLVLSGLLASSKCLPLCFSGYCQMMWTDRAIDARDGEALRRGVESLAKTVTWLAQDPNTYVCLRPNLQNRAKLLMFAQLTRIRALLVLEDIPGLKQASLELLESVRRYDPFAIDRTTAVLIASSILRSLTVAAVMAWHARDADCFTQVVSQVSRLREACSDARLESVDAITWEDDRSLADALLTRLGDACWPRGCPDQRPEPEQLVAPVLLADVLGIRPAGAETVCQFLQSLDGEALR